MRQTVRSIFPLLLAGAWSTVIMTCVGCSVLGGSGASAVTCNEYVAADFNKQGDIDRDLLKSHDLEGLSMDNTMGLTSALEDFCGSTLMGHKEGRAERNGSRPIDDAVNWQQVKNSGSWPS
jgi:hypothetical protein